VVATGAVGNVTAGNDVIVALTGVSSTAAVGTLTPSSIVPLTGVIFTGAVGDVGVINPPPEVPVAPVGGAGLFYRRFNDGRWRPIPIPEAQKMQERESRIPHRRKHYQDEWIVTGIGETEEEQLLALLLGED